MVLVALTKTIWEKCDGYRERATDSPEGLHGSMEGKKTTTTKQSVVRKCVRIQSMKHLK